MNEPLAPHSTLQSGLRCWKRMPFKTLLGVCQLFWSLTKSAQDALLWSMQCGLGVEAEADSESDGSGSSSEEQPRRLSWFLGRHTSAPTLVSSDAWDFLSAAFPNTGTLSRFGCTNFEGPEVEHQASGGNCFCQHFHAENVLQRQRNHAHRVSCQQAKLRLRVSVGIVT